MIVCQHEYPVGFGGRCPVCTSGEWQECLDYLHECLVVDEPEDGS